LVQYYIAKNSVACGVLRLFYALLLQRGFYIYKHRAGTADVTTEYTRHTQ